ncbi:hypothetical protein DFH07DRAFT_1060664 [Mycena maculata]|uniref:Uncharacterized protein n=1 Tax=Mycena maculata TaxID=230809 RepID=A0AAD7J6C5_9AGAR|nr:hypothetical protein DFH07DRAFT_1060664 [Mycena maculata]
MASSTNPLAVQELVDDCIDFLHDSPPDLKACALFGQSWASTAQMHLFNHIVIGFHISEEITTSRHQSRLLCAALAASPRLLRWVESLQIHLDTAPLETLMFLGKPYLERLRRIFIVGNRVSGLKVDAIQDLLSHTTLTTISISGAFPSLSDFLGIWTRCSTSIRDISFGSIRTWSAAGAMHPLTESPPSNAKIQIDALTLWWWSDGIHDWLNSPRCLFAFSNLKRLCLNENTSLPRWAAFAPSIPHVEYLQFEPLVPGLDLALFTNLKCISIFIGSLEYRAEVAFVFTTLLTMSSSNRIETVRFQLSSLTVLDADRGAELDRRILALPLPHHKAVELFYFSETPPPDDITEKLPLLNARKLVRAVCG